MIDDEKIYRYVMGADFEVGRSYNSPIPGRNDGVPSFSTHEVNGRILWKDFGFPDQKGYKAIDLLMYCYHLTYREALDYLPVVYASVPPETKLARSHYRDIKPTVVKRQMVDYELRYWYRFDIGLDTLIHERIWALESLSWGGTVVKSTPDDPAFFYDLGGRGWKLYWPIKKKFRQWQVDGLVEGFHSLEHREVGIIFSSTKDRIVGKQALGCTGVNPTSEGAVSSLVKLWAEIQPFADRWVIVYDADEPGFAAAKKTSTLLNIPFIDTRNKLHGNKDLADFVDKQRGNLPYEQLTEILLTEINKS